MCLDLWYYDYLNVCFAGGYVFPAVPGQRRTQSRGVHRLGPGGGQFSLSGHRCSMSLAALFDLCHVWNYGAQF